MLGFVESFVAFFLSTLGPAALGLGLVSAASRIRVRYLAAFCVGIFFWFFSDTIGDSAYLDLSAGFSGGVLQVALISIFIVGVLFFFYADSELFAAGEVNAISYSATLLAALALGLHGLGEGAAFGATASSTPNGSLVNAFGGLSAGIAYVLHKILEPMMVGVIYLAFSSGGGLKKAQRVSDLLALAVVFVLPSLVGAASAYYLAYDSTYLFALGLGGSVYLLFRLARLLFTPAATGGRFEGPKMAIALLVGFALIYLSALFHG